MMTPRSHIVVMGVAGAGKSTIGAMLAKTLGWRFSEGDDFHHADAVAKMARGEALDDDDRSPWLEALGTWVRQQHQRTIVSCSALKRSYRDRLRETVPDLYFVHLSGAMAIAESRVALRSTHFMPATLVASQFRALEPLEEDEAGMTLDLALPVDLLVDTIIQHVAPAEAHCPSSQ